MAGCRDYWSKYEHAFHLSPTANKHDAVAAVERALADHEALFGRPLREQYPVDPADRTAAASGHHRHRQRRTVPLLPLRGFIALHPELAHVRTRVRTPGQNGSRERGFGTLKYERLYLDQIDDAVALAAVTAALNGRPRKTLSWRTPAEALAEHLESVQQAGVASTP